MRPEDIVGLSFFALLLPSLVFAIAGSRSSLAPALRARRQSLGLGLIAIVLIAFGVVNFLLIHNSPRPVVEGNLWNIREAFSRSAHGASFMITDATGHAVLIRCNYSGPGLVEGERARVRYVAYNNQLLEMDMLTGSYQAWHLREPSGERACWMWVAIGLICAFFAWHRRKQNAASSQEA